VDDELIDHRFELVLAFFRVVPRDVRRGVRVVRGELLGELLVHLLLRQLELIGRDDDHGLGLLESVEVGDWRRRFLLALVLLSLGLGAILLGSLFDAVERGTRGVRDGGSMDRWF
jgi:hypothetical protein